MPCEHVSLLEPDPFPCINSCPATAPAPPQAPVPGLSHIMPVAAAIRVSAIAGAPGSQHVYHGSPRWVMEHGACAMLKFAFMSLLDA